MRHFHWTFLLGSVLLSSYVDAAEAAHLADKADVTEEIVRLEGHLAQAETAVVARWAIPR